MTAYPPPGDYDVYAWPIPTDVAVLAQALIDQAASDPELAGVVLALAYKDGMWVRRAVDRDLVHVNVDPDERTIHAYVDWTDLTETVGGDNQGVLDFSVLELITSLATPFEVNVTSAANQVNLNAAFRHHDGGALRADATNAGLILAAVAHATGHGHLHPWPEGALAGVNLVPRLDV